jgi:hypothetical protein
MNPKGSICAYFLLRYRQLMWNNHTAQALPCIKHAQIAAKMHAKDKQALVQVHGQPKQSMQMAYLAMFNFSGFNYRYTKGINEVIKYCAGKINTNKA